MSLVSSCTGIENFNSSNMVIVMRWKGKISLINAFSCLPILVVDNKIVSKTKGKKIKIPYYGIEDVIVSIRYKSNVRGIREMLKKQSDNFVSVDLQSQEKNVHIKLSQTNITIMGVTLLEHAMEVTQCLIDLIQQCDENLTFLRNCLSEEVDKCLLFFEELFKKYLELSIKNSTEFSLPNYDDFLEIIKKEITLTEELHLKICEILLVYAYEYKDYKSFSKKIDLISSCEKIETSKIKLTYFDISTSLYNYHLSPMNDLKSRMNGIFILKNLAFEINNLGNNNVIASHHNWKSKYCDVAISENIVRNDGEIIEKVHRFNISEKGSIRQWSPDTKEFSYNIHNKIIAILKLVIQNSNNVFIPSN